MITFMFTKRTSLDSHVYVYLRVVKTYSYYVFMTIPHNIKLCNDTLCSKYYNNNQTVCNIFSNFYVALSV